MSMNDWFVDFVIMLGIFGISLLQLTASAGILIPDSFTRRMLGINVVRPTLFGASLVLMTVLPLLIRRKYSWVSFIACLLAWIIGDYWAGDAAISLIPLLISLASLSAIREMDESLVAGAISLGTVIILSLLAEPNLLINLMLIQNISLVIAVTGGGMAYKMNRDLVKAAEERAERAEEAARAETKQRLEEERVAIARELHDITAHSLSAISIQAAAAEAQIDTNSVDAKNTIQNIRDISKSSLTEIRRMVGVLRDPAIDVSTPEFVPSLGTESLPEIVQYFRGAFINCTLNVDGYDKELVPKYLDVAIFGIIREAATNIVRHAHATRASIFIKNMGDRVEVEITDNGCGMNGANEKKADVGEKKNDGGGHGIEGMKERCIALGGQLEVLDNDETGGTIVKGWIPLK